MAAWGRKWKPEVFPHMWEDNGVVKQDRTMVVTVTGVMIEFERIEWVDGCIEVSAFSHTTGDVLHAWSNTLGNHKEGKSNA